MELIEYRIGFESSKAIKAQFLVDFIVEIARDTLECTYGLLTKARQNKAKAKLLYKI